MAFRVPFFGSRGDDPAPRRERVRLDRPVGIKAKFDSASPALDIKHWAQADGLSADSALSPGVRKRLRERSRYECCNNSYARGIVLTLANDIIGTGPRLQMLTESEGFNREIEQMWRDWCSRVDLAHKLRIMHQSRVESGECFLAMTNNSSLSGDIKLDLDLIESDRVTSDGFVEMENEVDGVHFDKNGMASKYRVLRHHPGEISLRNTDPMLWNFYESDQIIHWYRPDRPGQSRGLPDITPALPLFSQLRRYTLAVLAAAESAADFAGILYTDAPPSGEADSLEPLDAIELESRMLMTMPAGWKMGQIKPEQPTTTYGDFKGEILNEIARCLNMPFNVASGNSSGYNYSSGRLDHQTYFKQITVERQRVECLVLNRVLEAWLREASLNLGMRSLTPYGDHDHMWFWDGQSHVDPQKEATATTIRLENCTTSLATEFAKQGKDWETELRQIAIERDLMRELGITEIEVAPEEPANEDAPEKKQKDEAKASATQNGFESMEEINDDE